MMHALIENVILGLVTYNFQPNHILYKTFAMTTHRSCFEETTGAQFFTNLFYINSDHDWKA